MLTLFRNFRLVYNSPCGDINRCVVVCIGRMATLQTEKIRLALAIGFVAMPTFAACSAAVSGIDKSNRYSEQLPFVGDELAKLGECPSTHLGSLLFTEPSPVSDASEFFNGDTLSGVFGKQHERFADNVIRVTAETSFLVADPLDGSPGILSGPTLSGHLPTERAADVEVFDANIFNQRSADVLAVAGGDKFGNAKINADECLNLDRSFVGKVDGAEQVKLAVAVDKIALTFEAVEPFPLVFSEDDWDDLPTLKSQQTNAIHALETHQPLIVGHRPVGLEYWAFGFIPLEAFNCLADGADSHLARQAEPFAKFPVTKCVDGRLRESLGVESDATCVGCPCVEPLHGRQQHPLLLGIGKNLDLQCQFHLDYFRIDSILRQDKSAMNGGVSTRNS